MTAAIPVMWNQINYPSRSAAAAALGVTISTMHNRVKRGYICDADMPGTGGVFRSGYGIPCSWNDVQYDSISAAARATGRWYSVMHTHIKKGRTCDMDIPPKGYPAGSTTWNGIKYRTIKAAAIANGVEHHVMMYRLASGYTNDKDVKYRRIIFWNGIRYATLTIAAKALGISHQALSQRLIKGYTCDADMVRKP